MRALQACSNSSLACSDARSKAYQAEFESWMALLNADLDESNARMACLVLLTWVNMLDNQGGLFLDKVFFFRSSFVVSFFWELHVASLFLWIPLLFWFFGLPLLFSSPLPLSLRNMKVWGGLLCSR